MTDSSVENLDDEELLMYYEATKKLLKSRMDDESIQNGKVGKQNRVPDNPFH